MSKKYLNTNQSHVKFFMLSQMRSQCEQLCELFAKILRKTGRAITAESQRIQILFYWDLSIF